MDFRKALKRSKIFALTALILLFLTILSINFNVFKLVFFIAFIISYILSLAIAFIYIRCPKCGGGLHGRYFKVSEFCPHCGHKLDLQS